MTKVLLEVSGLTRADLRRALDGRSFELIAGDGVNAGGRAQIEATQPDVIVIEAEGDEPISSLLPNVDLQHRPLVVLVAHADPAWANAALRAGVRAVIPRDAAELGAAIDAVASGFVVLHPDVADVRVPAVAQLHGNGTHSLTQREIEVLRMMAQGLANKAIAARLHISEHTVKFHVGSILTKLRAGSRTEAVATGARQGLVML